MFYGRMVEVVGKGEFEKRNGEKPVYHKLQIMNDLESPDRVV
jgi:hypothetical protein